MTTQALYCVPRPLIDQTHCALIQSADALFEASLCTPTSAILCEMDRLMDAMVLDLKLASRLLTES